MILQPVALPGVATAPWPTRPLGELTQRIFPGLPTGRRGAPADSPARGSAQRLLCMADLEETALPREALAAAPPDLEPRRLDRYRVAAGDVVLTCRGTRLRAALVDAESAGAIASANLLVLRPGPALQPLLLLFVLRDPATQQALAQRSRACAPRLSLRAADLATLPVPVPSAAAQAAIVEILLLAQRQHQLALRAAALRLQVAESLAQVLLAASPPASAALQEGEA